jgi:hypothetical protein
MVAGIAIHVLDIIPVFSQIHFTGKTAPFMNYQLISAAIGIGIAMVIFYLIRRDHLHSRHAFWWLLTAIAIAVLGIFPQLIDEIAVYIDVSYPPTLLLVIGLGLVLLKVLSIDIHQSQQERRLRRTVQRLALLEEELHRLRQETRQHGE